MAKIRILPEQLANRIAAGEVVERPASVVKELIENSLDAGADRIEVEIEGGGTRLIRVLDNGSGMDEDDVLLSFERHGTSKIDESHDLVAIHSLGFRGEAIPSIASVAKMSIVSRTGENELGTKALFEYGKLVKIHEVGCSRGTDIEVRNLFGRTPARKKFLRTTRTEVGHIEEIIKNYALASPQTSFALKVNGRQTLMLGSGHDLEQRLRSILHHDDTLIAVAERQPDGARELSGFLVPPERSISGSARLRLFINGRSIRDRLMSHAVFEGLRGFLLKGHAPAGYLHLRLPAGEVDVNVHPAKSEVRFRDSGAIHQFIKQSISAAMLAYQRSIQSAYFQARPEQERRQERRPTPNPEALVEPQATAEPEQPGYQEKQAQAAPATRADEESSGREAPPNRDRIGLPFRPAAHTPQETTPRPAPPPTETAAPQGGRNPAKHGLRVLGQFKNLYIFCQAGDELVVIDQHAAHERLVYEKLRRQYAEARVASQTLLFPETVELTPLQLELVENNLAELERMGFAISEFGGNTYKLSAVPALTGRRGAAEVFFDILEGFGSDRGRQGGGKIDEIFATMACKSAVRSGDALSAEEIDALLGSMAAAELFSHCPHGRPVFKSFTENEIKKWFYRT